VFVLVSQSCLQVASNGQFWNLQEPTKPGLQTFLKILLKKKKKNDVLHIWNDGKSRQQK
jgi:hypothetical protein